MQKMSKTAFAAHIGVSAGRISQMIKDGQIGRDALEGDGQRAMILVDVAESQLKERLDVNQRMGLNGLNTKLTATPEPLVDSVEAQIKAEKLAQSQLTTERMQRESRAASGVYIKASDARQEMGKIASSMMAEFESCLQPLADAVAGEFKLARRDVVLILKKSLRDWQKTTSERLLLQANDLPDVIDDEVETTTD